MRAKATKYYGSKEEAEKAKPYVIANEEAGRGWVIYESFTTKKQAENYGIQGTVMTRNQFKKLPKALY